MLAKALIIDGSVVRRSEADNVCVSCIEFVQSGVKRFVEYNLYSPLFSHLPLEIYHKYHLSLGFDYLLKLAPRTAKMWIAYAHRYCPRPCNFYFFLGGFFFWLFFLLFYLEDSHSNFCSFFLLLFCHHRLEMNMNT